MIGISKLMLLYSNKYRNAYIKCISSKYFNQNDRERAFQFAFASNSLLTLNVHDNFKDFLREMQFSRCLGNGTETAKAQKARIIIRSLSHKRSMTGDAGQVTLFS